MPVVRTSSSLRVRAPAETLAAARLVAPRLGITRVTDTTALDRLGVPVCASIRPTATRGSLCVSAGKGMTLEEAEAGAYMEAIELAWAEPGRCPLPRTRIRAADLLYGDGREPWLDFGPRVPIGADTPILAMEAADIRTGRTCLVPAERVLFPMFPGEGAGQFGSEGNGLCSGNSREEATLHGLAEVIERDVTSFLFDLARDTRRIRNETLPAHLAELAARTDRLGFDLHVRWAPNAYGLPYFLAGLVDRGRPHLAHRGDGLHPDAAIAATRAVCEAFQSRLTDIHGGRDDLAFHRSRDNPTDDTPQSFRRFVAALASGEAVDFAAAPDCGERARDIGTATALLIERLESQGMRHFLRVALAPPEHDLHVLRVIVPRLECRVGLMTRIGPRLREALATRTRA